MIEGSFDTMPLVTRELQSANLSYQSLHPKIDYLKPELSNVGSEIERYRLMLIHDLIQKRKVIREVTLRKLDELILSCENRILEIGDERSVRAYTGKDNPAAKWKEKILDLEIMKINEHKELFRDTLFLRNEWVKSLLDYTQEKSLDAMLEGIREMKG